MGHESQTSTWDFLQKCVAPFATFVGLVLLIIGLAIQDWDCKDCSVTTGGGYDDITWGTQATDYVLSILFITMAMFAPGAGAVRASFCGAAALDVLSWFSGAVFHTVKATTGEAQVWLFIIALVAGTLSRILRVFGIVCAIKGVGPCRCIRSVKVPAAICGVLGLTAIVLLPPAEVGAIPVPGWILGAVYQILMVLLTFILSVWALAVVMPELSAVQWAPIASLLGFVLAVVVNQVKPRPFKYSTDFNDNALFHTFFMFEAAAAFHVLRLLAAIPAQDDKSKPGGQNTQDDQKSAVVA